MNFVEQSKHHALELKLFWAKVKKWRILHKQQQDVHISASTKFSSIHICAILYNCSLSMCMGMIVLYYKCCVVKALWPILDGPNCLMARSDVNSKFNIGKYILCMSKLQNWNLFISRFDLGKLQQTISRIVKCSNLICKHFWNCCVCCILTTAVSAIKKTCEHLSLGLHIARFASRLNVHSNLFQSHVVTKHISNFDQ